MASQSQQTLDSARFAGNGNSCDMVKALIDDLEIITIPRHEDKDEGIDITDGYCCSVITTEDLQ